MNNKNNESVNLPEEISILDIIRILWKHKIVICISTILFTAGTIIYSFLLMEEYCSTTIFAVNTGSSSNQNLSGLASLAGISLGNKSNVDPSDYLDKVVQDEIFLRQLTDRKWLYNSDSLYLHQILKIEPDTAIGDWRFIFEKSKIDILRENKLIDISKDKKTGILYLFVKMPSAQLSYDVNKYLIDLIGNYIRNSISSQAKEKREFIENRIAEAKPILESSENALAHFKERNFSGSSPDLMLTEMRLTREATMNQEVYIQFKKQYELALIEEKNDQTLIQIIKNPEVPLYRTSPKRKQFVILGCMMGFFIGCAISILHVLWGNLKKTVFI